jgi:hypothetical protein
MVIKKEHSKDYNIVKDLNPSPTYSLETTNMIGKDENHNTNLQL